MLHRAFAALVLLGLAAPAFAQDESVLARVTFAVAGLDPEDRAEFAEYLREWDDDVARARAGADGTFRIAIAEDEDLSLVDLLELVEDFDDACRLDRATVRFTDGALLAFAGVDSRERHDALAAAIDALPDLRARPTRTPGEIRIQVARGREVSLEDVLAVAGRYELEDVVWRSPRVD